MHCLYLQWLKGLRRKLNTRIQVEVCRSDDLVAGVWLNMLSQLGEVWEGPVECRSLE
jgi:hypothetical protein